jgi:nitroimidazol reductase NimA-like FMN-containing flavoprotein (pyridoxamine 5'-phosphate oxidase superfamily)
MEGTVNDRRKYIIDFLQQEKIGFLSMVREDGLPDSTIMYFFLDEHLAVYFLSRNVGQKINNITAHSQVVFSVFRQATKEFIQVRGVANIVPLSSSEIVVMLKKLSERIENEDRVESVLPLLKHTKGEVTMIKIVPAEILWRRYSERGLEEETICV